MEPSLTERFTGAAAYYARFRPDYPPELLERLADRLGLNDAQTRNPSRLLDLGCGPGTISLPMRERFEEVVGLDVNAAMLGQARARASELNASNVRFEMRPAEEIGADLGAFRLVTVGRALHWMNREVVIERAFDILEPGGGFATLGSSSDDERPSPWRVAANAVIGRYLGPKKAPSWHDQDWEHHELLLSRSRFSSVEVGRFETNRAVSLDGLVGRVFSMSSSAPERFGDRLDEFETDLRRALLEIEPSGTFSFCDVFDYALALKN
jgi:SAM-dependent methyltransferase